MKSLRKSLNSNRDSSSRPQISTPPPSAILPPQKVIRALSSYRSQAPQELSFLKGDFFYVLKDSDQIPTWYEAHNPVTGARGLVPRAMFEEFGKNAPQNRTSQAASVQSMSPPVVSPVRSDHIPKSQVFYAIVLHDFSAERADELDAKRGDPITVVAQSNREWFVAKPIGRLGRPGLIPVSFVEIHDPTTGKAIPDVEGLMDRGELPKVEDWKRAMLNYKQNSIALGVIDAPSSGASPNTRSPPEGILLTASVVSFHFEMDEYWFRIDAIYQPYNRSGQTRLPPSKNLILFLSLLDSFPREAGRQPPEPRTLPYMPGPAQQVDDQLTATRKGELDDYVQALCDLGKTGGRYILEHMVVRKFLALKPGDVENEGEPRAEELDELFNDDPLDDYSHDAYEIREQMARMNVQHRPPSDGSEYEDEGYAPSPQRKNYDKHPYSEGSRRYQDDSNLRLHALAQNHQRSGSSASFNQSNSYASNSRSNSPLQREGNGSPQPRSGQSSRWNDSGYQPPDVTLSSESFRSSQASQTMSSRSRSHSNATANLNNPPISAANPQTAFVKIKIFDRVADDLIAIRVHPKVTHAELMDKVQARLGSEVANLRYRDSMTNTFVGLDTDEELRAWMDGTDKHVLYAD
ncbi:hypothetical protein CPB84DRAFT_1811272 [Gymnopilus junonius]|uniref:SH3 domain-containing protein n=1 Tax=Gymnopilus junonius TaxID=109634 RepID=A0A9P5P418_GYMJU|nr:hypothetical protein CPB84DRAFT_1811272 [Gymnopilus junonius]